MSRKKMTSENHLVEIERTLPLIAWSGLSPIEADVRINKLETFGLVCIYVRADGSPTGDVWAVASSRLESRNMTTFVIKPTRAITARLLTAGSQFPHCEVRYDLESRRFTIEVAGELQERRLEQIFKEKDVTYEVTQ